MSGVDVTHSDSGNYTCQVEGPQNTILGRTTHVVYVRGQCLHTYRHRHHRSMITSLMWLLELLGRYSTSSFRWSTPVHSTTQQYGQHRFDEAA